MKPASALRTFQLTTAWILALVAMLVIAADVERHGFFEASFQAASQYANPYTNLDAEAELKLPDGSTRRLPLFWDGGDVWKLRVSPDATGEWSFTVRSKDPGLGGKSGGFTCVTSNKRGSVEPMKEFPHHFQYQDGTPLWFMGDTAWALFTDNAEEKHDRAAAENYLRVRASQGFNVVHAMVLSEAGWGNSGGLPFKDMAAQTINPGYWREMDHRVGYANEQNLVVGFALAWGDKRKQEPFAWRMFPSVAARKRYARYIAARYGAYDVFFLVAGEWHGEVRTRPSTEAAVKKEFFEIGDALAAADAPHRMIGIHPMSRQGSVREFNEAEWMSFGDYQQNYHDLHARILESRRFNKPVVNSEYGYHLRDQNGDGVPDKDNSTTLAAIRHASWDIATAGAYFITGFGTTSFGGHRDPGPFDVDAAKNDEWEKQAGFIQQLFTGLEWWKLEPHDELLAGATPRDPDGGRRDRTRPRQGILVEPPAATYWCLADPGKQYLLYARGLKQPVTLHVEGGGGLHAHLFDPRTGKFRDLAAAPRDGRFEFQPPDEQDWVVVSAGRGTW